VADVIPTATLPDRVTVEDAAGHSAVGPVFATARTVPARYTGGRKLVRGEGGQDATATASFTFRPDVRPPVGSRITRGADTYTVLEVIDSVQLRRAWATVVLVEGPR
jgi:hypothetical protein